MKIFWDEVLNLSHFTVTRPTLTYYNGNLWDDCKRSHAAVLLGLSRSRKDTSDWQLTITFKTHLKCEGHWDVKLRKLCSYYGKQPQNGNVSQQSFKFTPTKFEIFVNCRRHDPHPQNPHWFCLPQRDHLYASERWLPWSSSVNTPSTGSPKRMHWNVFNMRSIHL